MSMLMTLALAYAAFRLVELLPVPQFLAETIATPIGVRFVLSSHQARKLLLARATTSNSTTSNWDKRPTRAERRALRQALSAALDLTTFTSLLPDVATRSYKVAHFMQSARNAARRRTRA